MGKVRSRSCRYGKRQEDEEKKAQRSVFVYGGDGFSKETTEQDINAYFTQNYGAVEEIFLHQRNFAIVTFSTTAAVSLTLAHAGDHLFKGRKLIVRPRLVNKVVPQPKSDNPVPVASAEPKSDNPVPVASAKPKLADPVTSAEPQLEGCIDANHQKKLDEEKILAILNSAQSVCHQMEALQLFFQLSDEAVTQRAEIQTRLQSAFDKCIEGAELHQFGSSVNGFGTKYSDMDLFLDLKLDQPSAHFFSRKTLRTVMRAHTGKASLGSFLTASVNMRFSFLTNIITKAGGTKFVVIKRARCPVIKFVDGPSKMSCDLTINNRLGLQNTKLLQQLCLLDSRLRPLMFTVKHWASGVVTGNGGSGPHLSKYALAWLLIHYLQQCEPPVLPSIGQLAQLAGPADQAIIEGWDCGFTRDLAQTANFKVNSAGQDELLKGFFNYYSRLDLTSVVLSPREGRAITVSEFQETIATTGTAAAFKLGDINIQDPFVLDHNIAYSVNTKTKVLIMQEFAEAAAKCANSRWSTTSTDSNWGISYLIRPPRILKTTNPKVVDRHNFSVPFIRGALPPMLAVRWGGGAQAHNRWLSEVCGLLRRTLEDILCFQCYLVQDNVLGPQTGSLRLVDTGGAVTTGGTTESTVTTGGTTESTVTTGGTTGGTVTTDGTTEITVTTGGTTESTVTTGGTTESTVTTGGTTGGTVTTDGTTESTMTTGGTTGGTVTTDGTTEITVTTGGTTESTVTTGGTTESTMTTGGTTGGTVTTDGTTEITVTTGGTTESTVTTGGTTESTVTTGGTTGGTVTTDGTTESTMTTGGTTGGTVTTDGTTESTVTTGGTTGGTVTTDGTTESTVTTGGTTGGTVTTDGTTESTVTTGGTTESTVTTGGTTGGTVTTGGTTGGTVTTGGTTGGTVTTDGTTGGTVTTGGTTGGTVTTRGTTGGPVKRQATFNTCDSSLKRSRLDSDQHDEPPNTHDAMVTEDGNVKKEPEKYDKLHKLNSENVDKRQPGNNPQMDDGRRGGKGSLGVMEMICRQSGTNPQMDDGRRGGKDSLGVMEMICRTSYTMFAARYRKAAQNAVTTRIPPFLGGNVDLELEITKELLKTMAKSKIPLVECRVLVKLTGNSTADGIVVECKPTRHTKSFEVFLLFFPTFFKNLLQKVFQEAVDDTTKIGMQE